MISVAEADKIIQENLLEFTTLKLPFDKANNYVLAEDIVADRDFPPFNRASMDGIAISFESFAIGIRKFKIENVQAAGSPQLKLENIENCLEVMTGAVAPINTDTIIRYEDVSIENGIAHVNIEDVRKYQNNHLQGTDRKQGEIIIKKNTLIRPAEIGVIASVGKHQLEVYEIPKLAIISTGEELVEVSSKPLPHQIRKSNVHTVASVLRNKGIQADLFHLPDHQETIEQKIEEIASEYPILILSGGVSKGKFDYLPKAFENIGITKQFHRIEQRPGKPFWFGTRAKKNIVFSFPGNPVSTFMCLHRYFFPWLNKCLGLPQQFEEAMLDSDFDFKPNLQYFLQVQTYYKNGVKMAKPISGRGSGDLANLVLADSFLELPNSRIHFKKGEVFPLIPFV